jgi:hypothetical protein
MGNLGLAFGGTAIRIPFWIVVLLGVFILAGAKNLTSKKC